MAFAPGRLLAVPMALPSRGRRPDPAPGVAGYLYYDYHRDEPQAFFDNPVMQFKYGSTGGDRLAGVPVGIWNALPKLCRKYFPGEGWQSLGIHL